MDQFEKMLTEIRASGLPAVIYGAGELSGRIRDHLVRNSIVLAGYIVDKAYLPAEREKDGLPVFAVEDYLPEHKCNIVVGVMYFSEEREAALGSYGSKVYTADYSGRYPLGIDDDCKFTDEFLAENREAVDTLRRELADDESRRQLDAFIEQRRNGCFRKSFSAEPQYFEKGIFVPGENEVFVDCGAYDGDTVLQFAKLTGGSYSKIYAFEADPDNIAKMRKNTAGMHGLTIVPKGVFDRDTTVFFANDGKMTSHVSESGVGVEMTSIDNTVGSDEVTFIKMDIEGSELKALEGARKTIERCKPRLAICVYHRIDDIIAIPEFIRSTDIDYRLYFRNYHSQSIEAVIYAIHEGKK